MDSLYEAHFIRWLQIRNCCVRMNFVWKHTTCDRQTVGMFRLVIEIVKRTFECVSTLFANSILQQS